MDVHGHTPNQSANGLSSARHHRFFFAAIVPPCASRRCWYFVAAAGYWARSCAWYTGHSQARHVTRARGAPDLGSPCLETSRRVRALPFLAFSRLAATLLQLLHQFVSSLRDLCRKLFVGHRVTSYCPNHHMRKPGASATYTTFPLHECAHPVLATTSNHAPRRLSGTVQRM